MGRYLKLYKTLVFLNHLNHLNYYLNLRNLDNSFRDMITWLIASLCKVRI